MKTILKYLLILLLIITAIVVTIMIKSETTISDAELITVIPTESDQVDSSNTEDTSTLPTICLHKETYTTTIDASCIISGKVTTICNECGGTIQEITIPQVSHNLKTVTTDASCTIDGKTVTVCEICNEVMQETITPKLSHKIKTITINATCSKKGEVKNVCEICNITLKTEYIEQESHLLTIIDEKPETPFEDGYRLWKCDKCEYKSYITILFSFKGDVDLYAPSAGIHCAVNLGECNQSNTDQFDVSCDMNFIDNNNPLFFGHNTRTLGKLHKLKKGDLMYFTINGETTVYKVTVSEEGYLINGGINIQGKETGTLCISSCEKNTLHFFTCHPTIYNYNARWIVFAEKVEL